MILVSCVLLYLAIVKRFEPPAAAAHRLWHAVDEPAPALECTMPSTSANGVIDWAAFRGTGHGGLIDYLYLGVKLGIYPCLIFVGVGAMTDFGPLIANPKSLLLGAAAQVGIFPHLYRRQPAGLYRPPVRLYRHHRRRGRPHRHLYHGCPAAPELLGPIAVAAYSYMALVPVIQPPS